MPLKIPLFFQSRPPPENHVTTEKDLLEYQCSHFRFISRGFLFQADVFRGYSFNPLLLVLASYQHYPLT